jgi:hypothetical protein
MVGSFMAAEAKVSSRRTRIVPVFWRKVEIELARLFKRHHVFNRSLYGVFYVFVLPKYTLWKNHLKGINMDRI